MNDLHISTASGTVSVESAREAPAHSSSAPGEDPRPTRPCAPALDAVLGETLPVLDQGFVRVVDYMGTDASVVQAARVSYGAGTKRVHEDRGLIRYLLRHWHTTPFEMCEIKLHVRVPMDTWRQWVRHRTANVNEYSTRYSLALDAAQRTAPDEWRAQSADNRQGSGGFLGSEVGGDLSARERALQAELRAVYDERVAAGVAREQARKDLPLSTYTEAYWKIDLHNLLRFLLLRMDPHAQQEIHAYATTIGHQVVARWVPMVWEAFLDYQLDALQLSRIDADIVALIVAGREAEAAAEARRLGLVRGDERETPTREGRELAAKLRRLGLRAPWGQREG